MLVAMVNTWLLWTKCPGPHVGKSTNMSTRTDTSFGTPMDMAGRLEQKKTLKQENTITLAMWTPRSHGKKSGGQTTTLWSNAQKVIQSKLDDIFYCIE